MEAIKVSDKSKILDNLPGMIFQCAYTPPNFIFVFASEGCAGLTGYTPEEFTGDGGLKYLDIVHHEDIQELEKLHDMTLAFGIPLETSFRIITKAGTEKWVVVRSRVSETNSEGMPHVIEGIFTDITKQLSIDSSSKKNRENSDFWAKMGHGVRTPMNAIIGLAELGLREDMPDTVREYTHLIKKAGEKLMSSISDILDYTKIERGELELYPEEYTVSSLANDVISIVKEEVSNTNLEFAVYIDSKIPNILVGDAIRLRQVLLGILSNAVKFTDKGYISLSISGEIQGEEVLLNIIIEDTGRGIKEEDITNLFKEFTQFDMKNIEGTGLGLTITSNLVKLMDGDIQVSSAYGIGSVFTVTLSQGIGDNTGAPTPICKVSNPEDKNVLIFERRRAFKNTMLRTFRNLGVQHEAVVTEEDFHDSLTSGEYAFVFVAQELYENYKENYPDVEPSAKIVLITEPLFCLPVADILNDSYRDDLRNSDSLDKNVYVNFIAPEARVLIVDDIRANLTVAEGLLLPYKMQIDSCEGGAEAIEAVKAHHYDLILMDHMMPVMNGVEATLCIRDLDTDCETDCKNVPIVALTANTEYAARRMFYQNGFDDFLAKPINIYKLNEIVKKWVAKEKQQIVSESALTEAADDQSALNPGFEIAGIDVNKGIRMTGGSLDVYMRVIKNYYENGRTILKELQQCMRDNDMELYAIRVHALNSLSESIGASEVSKAAAALERATEESDIDFIQANNSDFMKKFEKLLDNMQPVVTNDDSKTNTAEVTEHEMEKKKILIIDDTDTYLLILNDILKDDYDTSISMDGEDGLETARIIMPDLILLDVMMPGMSGYEVLETLKADETMKSIPVILISGKGSEKNEAKGYELGAAGYIKKPFDKTVVKDTVDSMMK